jgi:phosphatidylserine decarboxylase
MEKQTLIIIPIGALLILLSVFLYWRFSWFFRNPPRTPPPGASLLSPADGTVVYVKTVEPHEEVIVIKQGIKASINDIVREHLEARKILIGIFMSPFNVHYNRAPLSGRVEYIKHYHPTRKNANMGPMHLRTLLKRDPYCENSLHIIQNERTVTRIGGQFKNAAMPCYIVQIAGKSVDRIESYHNEGELVERGAVFGMIRLGSQVDMVVPWIEGMQIMVKPGDKVRAGETVLIE